MSNQESRPDGFSAPGPAAAPPDSPAYPAPTSPPPAAPWAYPAPTSPPAPWAYPAPTTPSPYAPPTQPTYPAPPTSVYPAPTTSSLHSALTEPTASPAYPAPTTPLHAEPTLPAAPPRSSRVWWRRSPARRADGARAQTPTTTAKPPLHAADRATHLADYTIHPAAQITPASAVVPAPTPVPASAAELTSVVTPPTDTAPLPTLPPGEIATLPTLQVDQPDTYPVSPVTGQPRRPALVGLASGCFWAAGAVTAVAYGWLWWTAASVTRLTEAARLFAWTTPDPVSALAVTLVIVTALITVIVIAACGTIAYNAWHGQSWARIGGLIALAVTGLTYLLHPYALFTIAPAAIGAALLWLPPIRRFTVAMTPPVRSTTPVAVDARPIRYGRQPLMGDLS